MTLSDDWKPKYSIDSCAGTPTNPHLDHSEVRIFETRCTEDCLFNEVAYTLCTNCVRLPGVICRRCQAQIRFADLTPVIR